MIKLLDFLKTNTIESVDENFIKNFLFDDVVEKNDFFGLVYPNKDSSYFNDVGNKIILENNNEFNNDFDCFIEGDVLKNLKSFLKSYNSKVDLIFVDTIDKFKTIDDFNKFQKVINISKNFLSEFGYLILKTSVDEYSKIKTLTNEIFGEFNYATEIITDIEGEPRFYIFYCKDLDYVLSAGRNFNYKIDLRTPPPFYELGTHYFFENGVFYTIQNSTVVFAKDKESEYHSYPFYYNPKTKKFSLEKTSDDDILFNEDKSFKFTLSITTFNKYKDFLFFPEGKELKIENIKLKILKKNSTIKYVVISILFKEKFKTIENLWFLFFNLISLKEGSIIFDLFSTNDEILKSKNNNNIKDKYKTFIFSEQKSKCFKNYNLNHLKGIDFELNLKNFNSVFNYLLNDDFSNFVELKLKLGIDLYKNFDFLCDGIFAFDKNLIVLKDLKECKIDLKCFENIYILKTLKNSSILKNNIPIFLKNKIKIIYI